MVDLFDFEWPPAMLQYLPVEMRVIQTIAPVMTDYSTRGPWFRVISPVEVINPLALKLANAEWFAVMERATLDLLRTNPPAMKLGNEIPASKR